MRVLLVEDEPTLRHGLGDLLEGAGHYVEPVENGLQAVARGVSPEIDLVLLDLALPGLDGLEVCRRLRMARPELLILMLTARVLEDDKVTGLSTGADDYVTKPFAARELLARIEALGRRFRRDSPTPTPEQVELDGCTLDLGRCTATREGQTVPLTAREVRILRLLYQNRVRAMTRGELLEKAWGASSNLQTRTVDMTIANLRQKIERDPGLPRIVSTVKGVGYAWGGPVKRFHTRWAIALAAAAVLIPAAAWYLIGARQLAREADQLLEVARHESSSSAERMAAHLAIRLEELLDLESNRPHVHYWHEFFSRGDSCGDPRLKRSPLAWKRHKLIAAHFLLDQQGRITSPEPSVDVHAIDFADPTTAASRSPSLPASIGGPPSAVHATVMLPPANASIPERAQPDESAQVTPFRWQTGSWESSPALMAVRQVITGGETFVQGFAVDHSGLQHWLFELGSPAKLLPGEPRAATDARVPILGATWHIQVEPGPRLDRAVKRAALLSRQFHQSYFGGVLGAMLAGFCLVVLIRRSERLAEERSRFAAAAAHELRTPLAGIRLHGEMLALSLGNPRRVTEYAARITDEAERLTRLVSNVFSYTQVDQKLLRIHTEPGDIGQAVREALTLVQPIVERLGAELVLRIECDLPPINFDKDAVHQMVRNLVDNAEKYSRGCSDRRIEVEVTSSPEGALLTVRDHGSGISLADRSGIFQPFSRHARSAEISGLGLGLAVVRTLALAHGGRVDYRDADGGGACFTVRFPIDGSPAPLSHAGPQPA